MLHSLIPAPYPEGDEMPVGDLPRKRGGCGKVGPHRKVPVAIGPVMSHTVLGQRSARGIDGRFRSQYQAAEVHDDDSPVNLLTKGKRGSADTQQHSEHTAHEKANGDTPGAAVIGLYGLCAGHLSSARE